MKKGFLVIAVLVLAGIPGMLFFNGILMERTVQKGFQDINQMYSQTGSDLKLAIVEYDRGLFDTRFEWKIDFGSLEPVYGIKDIRFVETASHGFLGITSETSLEKNLWFTDWVNTHLNGKNPLKIQTRYAVSGPIFSTISLDEFSITPPKSPPLSVKGLDMTVSVDKSFEKIEFQGNWAGLFENEENGIGPVHFDSQMTRLTRLLWQGKGSMTVDRFTIDEDQEKIDLSNLALTYHMTATEDKKELNLGMGMTADQVDFNGQDLSGWSFQAGVNHMDAQAYENLILLYSKITNQYLSQMSNPNIQPEEIQAIMGGAMAKNSAQIMAEVEKLLKKGLEIQVSQVDMKLPQGKIEGRFLLGLKKNISLAQFILFAGQPSLALDYFSLESELCMPRELAGPRQDLTAPVFPGMETGLFVPKGDRLCHGAETKDGKLYLNGTQVVLDQP